MATSGAFSLSLSLPREYHLLPLTVRLSLSLPQWILYSLFSSSQSHSPSSLSYSLPPSLSRSLYFLLWFVADDKKVEGEDRTNLFFFFFFFLMATSVRKALFVKIVSKSSISQSKNMKTNPKKKKNLRKHPTNSKAVR
jgi:hypothetical protein